MAQTTELRAETAIQIGVGNTAVAIAVDASNNVGFGTTAPNYRMHSTVANSGENYIQITNTGTGVTSGDGFLIGIDATENCHILNQENTDVRIGTNGIERARYGGAGNYIFNYNNIGIDWRAETTGLTYGIHVDAGNDAVGIGGAASASYTCQVTGTLNVTGAITGSSCCSDEALKANITPLSQRISGIRNRFMGLVPIRYDWNPAPWIAAGIDPPDEPASFKWGFSAQNVEAAGLGDLVGTVSVGNFLAPEDPQPGSDEYQEIGGVRTGAPHVYKSFGQVKLMPAVVLMTQWLIDHAETTRNQLDVAKTRVQTLEAQMAQAIARIQALENP